MATPTFPAPSAEEHRLSSASHALHVGGAIASAGVSPTVLERLETIRELADATHRQMPLIEERQHANTARGDAQRRLDQLTAHPHTNFGTGYGFGLPETDARVIQQQQVLAQATAAAQRLDDRYRRAIEKWTPRARTRRDCEAWFNNRPGGTAVTDYVGPEPQLAKHRVESAPFPLAHARERLRQIIDQVAQAPNVSMLIEHEAGNIGWPTRTLTSAVMNAEGQRPIAFAETENMLALMLWGTKDLWLKRLDALLVQEADEPASLSIEARQVQAATIQDDLLAVSRDLAWWTWKGLDAALPVWFPADLNPAAILGAELITVANGSASPGTDLSHIVTISGPR
jgi:hypothetical protein